MIDLKPIFHRMRDYSLKGRLVLPVLPPDFYALQQFMPDKKLLCYFAPSNDRRVLPISWYTAYLYVAHRLSILHNHYEARAVFNPACTWAAALDTYTFSREFLEYLLEDLTKEEQTEGALLVIKKLAEMDEEEERFAI